MLQPFLNLLLSRELLLGEDELRERLGAQVVHSLTAMGVLVPQDVSWVRCPDYPVCHLTVMSVGSGLVALPPEDATCCEPRCIGPEHLRGRSLCLDSWVGLLRRLFRLSGSYDLDSAAFGQTYRIGQQRQGANGSFDYLYCIASDLGELQGHLAKFRAQRRDVVVLCPTRERVHVPAIISSEYCAPRENVRVAFLDEHLRLADDQIVLDEATSKPDGEPSAHLVSHEGPRVLTQLEHQQLGASLDGYDLVIDVLSGSSRHVGCHYRDEGGLRKVARLSAARASVAIELIVSGRPLRPRQFKSLERGDNAEHLFRRMRELIDHKPGGGSEYRAFKTLPGVGGEGKHFSFEPPRGYRFAVVLPLEHKFDIK